MDEGGEELLLFVATSYVVTLGFERVGEAIGLVLLHLIIPNQIDEVDHDGDETDEDIVKTGIQEEGDRLEEIGESYETKPYCFSEAFFYNIQNSVFSKRKYAPDLLLSILFLMQKLLLQILLAVFTAFVIFFTYSAYQYYVALHSDDPIVPYVFVEK